MYIPVLPALREALVQIRTDDALVELGSTDIFHAVKSVLMCMVLDEAEAARSLLETIKTHD
jgi:hypothetical protein